MPETLRGSPDPIRDSAGLRHDIVQAVFFLMMDAFSMAGSGPASRSVLRGQRGDFFQTHLRESPHPQLQRSNRPAQRMLAAALSASVWIISYGNFSKRSHFSFETAINNV